MFWDSTRIIISLYFKLVCIRLNIDMQHTTYIHICIVRMIARLDEQYTQADYWPPHYRAFLHSHSHICIHARTKVV